ncbi:MAG: hypothetical protein AAGA03_10825, partial [Planctomycetota bacterium]
MKRVGYRLEQVERDQQRRTRRRRGDRVRRKRVLWLTAGGFSLLILLALPSIFSHLSIAQSLLSRAASEYGLYAEAESVRIGWITPLKITGLHARGDAGSEVAIDTLTADVTVLDWLRGETADLGEVVVRKLHVIAPIDGGSCALEKDLQPLLQTDSQGESSVAHVIVQEATLDLIDTVTQRTWRVSQAAADIKLDPDSVDTRFTGVLTEPIDPST